MKHLQAAGLLAFAVGACSAQRLPLGTLPPEYELPIVAPWMPDAVDAGVTADAGRVGDASSASASADAVSRPTFRRLRASGKLP
jgi:hypothetical protein